MTTTNHDDTFVSPVTLTPLVSSACLRRAERELSAAQTRIHELERDADNGARLLKEYDNSLRAANQRIVELESILDKTMTIPERNAQAQAGLVNAYRIESVICCTICGTVLDPNERECPRCEQDAVRDERTWFAGVQGGI